MQHPFNPQRRSFVIATAGATTALAGLHTAAHAQNSAATDRPLQFTSLAAAEAEVLRLAQGGAQGSGAHLNWAQTLVHCAQSIDYSITGFPKPNSRLFQLTVGSAAFGVFAWRGRMSHDLGAPIPGAPDISAKEDPAQALERLRASIQRFRHWSGPLQPHFAYGSLTQREYELAHAMHLANHLSAFQTRG